MYKIKNFDNWIENEESGKFGSGASEKIWLVNPKTGQKGVFKFPKIRTDGKITGEYYAEKISSELGKLLEIPCANVDIGVYKERLGSISYNLVGDNELLNEGINYIQEKYPNYDKDKFIDEVANEKYDIQMLEKLNINIKDILTMVIFDALIGNSDRHHSNWGYIYNLENNNVLDSYFCPLYDNGSSLCSYVDEEDINNILKDKLRYNALIDSKSKSSIGWCSKRPIKHFELIENICKNYYDTTIDIIYKIRKIITEESIKEILNNFDDEIISKEKKNLLLKFIIDRKNKILAIYKIENEVNIE